MALIFISVGLYGVIDSLEWRLEVLLFPMIAAALITTFAAAAMIQDTVRYRAAVQENPMARARTFHLDEYRGLIWYLGTIGVVMLFGLQIGLPLAVAILNKVALRETWAQTGLLTTLVVLVLLAFDSMFRVFWFEPLILRVWPFG